MARMQPAPEQERPNHHTYREEWLGAALAELQNWFMDRGHPLPSRIRMAIAFTGQGRTGNARGQIWNAAASEGDFYELFIRPDLAEPVTVLTVLTSLLVSAVLPADAGRGPKYRKVADVIGLLPPMRDPQASVSLRERLNALALALGPLPHQALNLEWKAVNVPPKQAARMLLFVCPLCEFPLRFAKSWMTISGPPLCARDGVPFELQEVSASDPTQSRGGSTKRARRRTASTKLVHDVETAAPAGESVPSASSGPAEVAADVLPSAETLPDTLPPSVAIDGVTIQHPVPEASEADGEAGSTEPHPLGNEPHAPGGGRDTPAGDGQRGLGL